LDYAEIIVDGIREDFCRELVENISCASSTYRMCDLMSFLIVFYLFEVHHLVASGENFV